MATFSDFYRQKLAESAPQQARPSGYDLSGLEGFGQAVKDSGPQSPLDWAIDILSRPLYGVTNAVTGVSEGIADSREGNPLSAVGGIAALPTNFLTGLFSTDKGVKRTFSKVLEEQTDVHGKINDPTYEDTENNVDPVLKGTLGLTLDIAADPLTWIPGAQIAKAGGLLVKGGKAAAGAGKAAVEAGRSAVKGEKVAEPALRAADEFDQPFSTIPDEATEQMLQNALKRPESVAEISPGTVEKWARTAPQPEVRKAWDVYEKSLKSLGSADVAKGTFLSGKIPQQEGHLAALFKKHHADDSLKVEPRFTNEADRTFTAGFKRAQDANAAPIRQELSTILGLVSKDAPVELPPINQWVSQRAKTGLPEDTQMTPALSRLMRGDQFPKDPVNSVGRLARIVGSPGIPQELRTEAANLVKQAYARAGEESKVAVTDTLAAFNLRKGRDEDAVRRAFGDRLFGFLERKADSSKMTGEKFEKLLREVGRLTEEASDPRVLDNAASKAARSGEARVGKATNPLDALTDTYGLPRYTRPEANTLEEAVAHRASLLAVKDPANEALLKALRTETSASPADLKQKYPVQHSNTRATDADRTVANRRYVRQLNTFFQYDLNKSLTPLLKARMAQVTGRDASEIAGLQRTAEWRAATYEAWDSIVESALALGIKLHVGRGSQEFVPLSYPDILRLTEKFLDNPELAGAVLFNGGTQVPPTRLMEAVHWLTTTGARGEEALEGVQKILRNKKLSGYKGQVLDKDLPNNLLGRKPYAHFTGAGAEKSARALALRTGGEATKNADKGWYVIPPAGGFADDLALALVKGADAFAARAGENAALYATRGISESKALTTSQLAKISGVLEAGSVEDQVAALAKIRAGVAQEAGDIGAFPSSVEVAKDAVEAAAGSFATTRARILQTEANKVSEGRKAAVSEGSTKVAATMGNEADEIMKAGGFEEVVPPGEGGAAAAQIEKALPKAEKYDIGVMDKDYGLPERAAQEGFVNSAINGLRQTFDQRFGMQNIFDMYHAKKSIAGRYLAGVTHDLRSLSKFTDEQILAGLRAVQAGARNTDPSISEASRTIDKVISSVFDTSGSTSILNSALLRTEPNIEHINAVLRQKLGKETSHQLEDATSFEDLANQWRNWDFTKPRQELYSIADAFATVAEHRGIVGNFLYEMGKTGGVSKTYQPGMVKIVNSGGSKFADLIPEGTYVQKDVARELHNLDVMIRTDRKFAGDIGHFVQNSFIPAQNLWKSGVTVWRLGHHVRNKMSNDFMSYVARGTRDWGQSQRDAMKVLGLRNEYEGVNLIDALTSVGDRIPSGKDVLFSGKRHSFTADEVAKIFQDHGLNTTFNISEDLMEDIASGRLAKLGSDINNSRAGQFVGGVSHAVDHHGKMQHLIQILRQESAGRGKWGKLSKAELVKRAVREVKRSHPDSLMLTPTEAKWRFLIPFYTWFAKTLPFAMESAARNPGRLMTIPKASYNLAVAMGLNPNSLSDPFPDDQLFPSFVTGGAFGPQFEIDGNYVNINPGVPQFDMLDQLLNPNPVQGVLGMTSPLLRVPAELATGSKIGGAPITDTSDYLDQNIPIVNYLANITGTSVTGTVPSLLQGKGLDPQSQVAKGNKDEFDQTLSVINWLTGLNAQNWSRPNFVNYAEIEKRNNAKTSDRSGF